MIYQMPDNIPTTPEQYDAIAAYLEATATSMAGLTVEETIRTHQGAALALRLPQDSFWMSRTPEIGKHHQLRNLPDPHPIVRWSAEKQYARLLSSAELFATKDEMDALRTLQPALDFTREQWTRAIAASNQLASSPSIDRQGA